MPTYEYACSACGHQWEQAQRITEAPIGLCPKCTKSAAHRLISGGTNFILKGGGWYSDLYSSAKPSSSEKSGDGKASESPAKSGESTPAKTGCAETCKSGGGESAKSGAASTASPSAAST
ncbi:MAG: zinc ribbon domain-containing protein [Myxococcales bacterium]|nr:zinc ribbon domain-containing protein [Myxococcales bacterium]